MAILDFLKGKKREDNPPEDRPLHFISAPMIWSAHVESYLEDKGIPYLKQGQKGAALAIELGQSQEIFDYYIPAAAMEKAAEGLEELKMLIGY